MTDKSLFQKIREQVEFYFSDSNLPTDKFLRTQVANHPEGFVGIDLIASFKRMKNLTTSVEEVRDAIKDSDLLEVDPTGTLVRRKVGLGDPSAILGRTIYAKPFPTDITIDAVKAFFEPHGKVNCVRLRKNFKTKSFKGSVFVEFASDAEANAVIKKELKYDDKPLEMKLKAVYEAGKAAERQQKRDQKKKEKEEQDKAAKRSDIQDNSVVIINGIEGDHNSLEIKKQLVKFGEPRFVEKFADAYYARYKTADEAAAAIKAVNEEKPKFNDKEISLVLVSGDKFNTYVDHVVTQLISKEESKKKKTAPKRKKSQKGGRPAKKQKTE